MYTDRQLRELFHFCFLERLLKVTELKLYVLKGGVNLRFFFHSPRYSEDMDLDVNAGSVTTLKKNGYKILDDAAFKRNLRTYGIEDIEINDPLKAKHTETTQRFRMRLVKTSGDSLPTKIEFSRRKVSTEPIAIEQIDPEIARLYKKLSFRCQHYPAEVVVLQKIKALAGRVATQARDVFDIGILHAGGFIAHFQLHKLLSETDINKARENLFLLSYKDYEGQVLEFLEDDAREQYSSSSTWEKFQNIALKLITNGH